MRVTCIFVIAWFQNLSVVTITRISFIKFIIIIIIVAIIINFIIITHVLGLVIFNNAC